MFLFLGYKLYSDEFQEETRERFEFRLKLIFQNEIFDLSLKQLTTNSYISDINDLLFLKAFRI